MINIHMRPFSEKKRTKLQKSIFPIQDVGIMLFIVIVHESINIRDVPAIENFFIKSLYKFFIGHKNSPLLPDLATTALWDLDKADCHTIVLA